MKIILNKNVENLGKAGEIVSVKDGYARNFLIPHGMATLATTKNISSVEKALKAKELKEARTRSNLESLAERLNKLTLKFELKAGEDEKLFGSVTTAMISESISQKGFEVDKKEIEMQESIKQLGNHFVMVKLGKDISARVKIKVTAEKQ